MLFASATFVVLFAITFILWHSTPFRIAKFILLIAGLIFYAYWYPPLLLLFFWTGIVDYIAGIRIHQLPDGRARKFWLIASISANLGTLFFFKYSMFVVDNFNALTATLGNPANISWSIILPLGISFYTFQSMSYTFDIYLRKMPPARNMFEFFSYLLFFPHLLAGPIVRAIDFIPQLAKRTPLTMEDIQFGIYRVTRGFFLKIVIADNIALSVITILSSDLRTLPLPAAWLGALYFGAQIFCDFAGYSDIAIGLARLLGFRLRENFNNPYFATSLTDFWGRWHISLLSWFRDYVYRALRGKRRGIAHMQRVTVVIFILSGLWHAANWTMLLWGATHGLALVAEQRLNRRFPGFLKRFPWLVRVVYVNLVWTLLGIPFLNGNLQNSVLYWRAMFDIRRLSGGASLYRAGMPFLLLFLAFEAVMLLREKQPNLSRYISPQVESWVYFALILLIPSLPADFIYFAF